MVASYKIKITAGLGSHINVGSGSVTYKNGAAALSISFFPPDNADVFTNYGFCANAVGANALDTEFIGTFGSGKNKNRGTSSQLYLCAVCSKAGR
jgi:hypothetical protein